MPEIVTPVAADYFKDQYTPNRVTALMGKAVDTDFNLHPSTVDKLEATTLASGRRWYPLPIGSKLYRGKWYPQWIEPTCSAWALASCITVVGIQPDKFAMARALNKANGSGFRDEYEVIREIGHNHPNVGFKELESSSIPIVPAMVDAIDRGSALLVGVDTSVYLDRKPAEGHNICVCGYEVTDRRYVNFQILDPNYGVVMISDNHLLASVIKDYQHLGETIPAIIFEVYKVPGVGIEPTTAAL